MECPIDHIMLSQNDTKPITFYPMSGNKIEAIVYICPKCHRKYIYIEGSSDSQTEYNYHGNTFYNLRSSHLMDALQHESTPSNIYSPTLRAKKKTTMGVNKNKSKRVKVVENKKPAKSYSMVFGSKSMKTAQEKAFKTLCPFCGKYVASLFSDKGMCWECYKEQISSRFD